MWLAKLKMMAVGLFTVAVMALTGLAYQALDAGKTGDTASLFAQAPAQPKSDSDRLQGTWRILDIVTDGKANKKVNPDAEADAIFKADMPGKAESVVRPNLVAGSLCAAIGVPGLARMGMHSDYTVPVPADQ